MSPPSRATLSADGRLLNADDTLLAINQAAGGGERLALPAVLALARLAGRLGVPIARPVLVADQDQDWEVWLRAVPDGDEVKLTLADWVRRDPAARQLPIVTTSPSAEPLLADGFGEPLRRALDGPLGRIVAMAESLRLAEVPALPHPYREYARDIAEAGRHLQSLVDDLGDLEQLEAGTMLALDAVDLGSVARRAAGLLAIRSRDRGLGVVHEGLGGQALGDERRILQIATNLLSNAVAHSPQGGRVTVTTANDDGSAHLTLVDEGVGIARSDQERIFGQYVRLSPDERPGSGLGLYISRRLARAMGGDVTVESEEGEGARFTLSLPSA